MYIDKTARKRIITLLYLIIVAAGIKIASLPQENTVFDILALTALYTTLMVSPIIVGRSGSIISILLICISFIILFNKAWIQGQQYYMLIFAFNGSSIISIIIIDHLYNRVANRSRHFHSQSITDELTGLYNRRHFRKQLKHLFENYKANKDPMALLIIDVDHFKNINDNYGHDTGDVILSGIADILKENIRENDIPCRIGGDEFAIILTGDKILMIQLIVDRIQEALTIFNTNIRLDKSVTLSIGGTLARTEFVDYEDLYKSADIALYTVKNAGRNGFFLDGEDELKLFNKRVTKEVI